MGAFLSSEMRYALHRLAQSRSPLGVPIGPSDVPANTAKALERRRIVRIEGTRVHLTETGRLLADDLYVARSRLLGLIATGEEPPDPPAAIPG